MKKKSKPLTNKPLTNKEGDVRELTGEDFAAARPLKDVFPELAAYAVKRKVGRPRLADAKKLQSFKLSPDVIARIRESGPGFNARVETALRQALEQGRI